MHLSNMASSDTDQKEKRSHKLEFVVRNSLLTDLFENVHVRTCYHFCIVTFLCFFISTAVSDYFKNENVLFGPIKLGFGKLHTVLLLWIGYFTGSCLNYFCFKIWTRGRDFLKETQLHVWNIFWLLCLISYYIFSFGSSAFLCTFFKLPPASATIVLMEQIRLTMKIHSFMRTNCPKLSTKKRILPSFNNFLYFLFAPTLIYRDTYPRTKEIRLNFLFFRSLEVLCCIFSFGLLFEKIMKPSASDFGIRKYTRGEILVCIFQNTFAGLLTVCLTFFLLLHSWFNFFAELLRFGDRLFYTDWWNSTNISHCLRRWNSPVQQWLYLYVYLDFHKIFKINKTMSKILLIVISGAAHDFIATFALGFHFPFMFLFYLIVSPLVTTLKFPDNKFFNVFTLYFTFWSIGQALALYTIEYYARINVPLKDSSWLGSLMPRFLTCDCIVA